MPNTNQNASLFLDKNAVHAHIETLQQTAERLSKIKMVELSTSQMMQIAMQLASVNGQIKAFNTMLQAKIGEPLGKPVDQITRDDQRDDESFSHFIQRTGAYHLKTSGILPRCEA